MTTHQEILEMIEEIDNDDSIINNLQKAMEDVCLAVLERRCFHGENV